MKKILSLLLVLFPLYVSSQTSDSKNLSNWMKDHNFSIRKTFDGSKDENKPAGITFKEDHLSKNDFFNIDVGAKISEYEWHNLILYPKIEWHKSTDTTAQKNKLDGGVNMEFYPFKLKATNIDKSLPNKGLKIAPWFMATSSFKRNFIDTVNETKITAQISLASNFKYMPGYIFRDDSNNFRFRYYPYLGIEYNKIPDLIKKGDAEKFSIIFVRLFADIWIIPQTIQITIDGTYRNTNGSSTKLRKDLPFLIASLNYYPGKQEAISIGYEYKHGYDSDSKYALIQVSSLKLNAKF